MRTNRGRLAPSAGGSEYPAGSGIGDRGRGFSSEHPTDGGQRRGLEAVIGLGGKIVVGRGDGTSRQSVGSFAGRDELSEAEQHVLVPGEAMDPGEFHHLGQGVEGEPGDCGPTLGGGNGGSFEIGGTIVVVLAPAS